MDRETERLLSLYLDDLLSAEEKESFEKRMAADTGLRRAVRLHRAAARQMAEMPELPPGLVAGARDRVDRREVAAAGVWWHRFWSLEIAGLMAAAVIITLVLYPFLRSDDPSRPPEESQPVLQSPKKPRVMADKLESAGYLEKEEPAEAGEPVEGPAAGDEPEPGRQRVERKGKAEEVASAPAIAADLAMPAPRKSEEAFARGYSPDGAVDGIEIPFRIQPYPEQVPLNEAGFTVLKGEADWKGDRDAAPIDFPREMAILLPARKGPGAAIRLEVVGVAAAGDSLTVLIREIADGGDLRDPDALPPLQAVIVPASELPIRLLKVE